MISSYRPLGFQQVTALNTAKALTVPAGATFAHIQAESKDVRWRDDGTNPTAALGTLLYAGQDMLYVGDVNKIRFIETAASATLNVHYYA